MSTGDCAAGLKTHGTSAAAFLCVLQSPMLIFLLPASGGETSGLRLWHLGSIQFLLQAEELMLSWTESGCNLPS